MPNNTSTVGNPYLFTGREYDSETELYYYRARYYDPRLGRFLQTDPIGYMAGLNLYTYCGNNPVNFVDPWGLEREREKNVSKIKGRLIKALKNKNFKLAAKLAGKLAKALGLNLSITGAGAVTGTLGPGYMVNIRAYSTGEVSISIGVGLGIGSGFSVTAGGELGNAGSVSVGITASGGTGIWGGEASAELGFEGGSVSAGGGWGVGGGISITGTGEVVDLGGE